MDLNKGWSYTGVWKNERSSDDSKEVSHFEVRKLVVKDVQGGITLTNEQDIEGVDKKDKKSGGEDNPVVLEADPKIEEENKRPVVTD